MTHKLDFEFDGKQYQLRLYTDTLHVYVDCMSEPRNLRGLILSPSWSIVESIQPSWDLSDELKTQHGWIIKHLIRWHSVYASIIQW